MSHTQTMTRGGDSRGGNPYNRNNDRSEAARDNFMAQFGSGLTALQPSILGFVAKQEMPHHLSILFRAR